MRRPHWNLHVLCDEDAACIPSNFTQKAKNWFTSIKFSMSLNHKSIFFFATTCLQCCHFEVAVCKLPTSRKAS